MTLLVCTNNQDPVLDDADAVDEPESDDYATELRDGSDLDREPNEEAATDTTEDLVVLMQKKIEDAEAANEKQPPEVLFSFRALKI